MSHNVNRQIIDQDEINVPPNLGNCMACGYHVKYVVNMTCQLKVVLSHVYLRDQH